MKMEYLKQTDNGNVLWRSFFNVDELIWNGKYTIKISDDDGTSQLPFSLGNDETVSLFVQDNGQEGTNENGRTIVQTITRVECSCGKVSTYTRTRYNDGGAHVWSQWNEVSEIPIATNTTLGGIMIGDGLSINASGRVSVEGKTYEGGSFVVVDTDSLEVKKFYTLPAPGVDDDYYKKIEKVSLNILGQQEDFFRFEEKNLGNIERIFYTKDYGVQANVPLHFVSYIYSEKEQETYYQLYEKNVGYLQNLIVHLKIGWNKLELEHTFETVTQNQLVVYLGKEANNDFYFYKTFVYNSIAKASVITEHTNDELAERLGKIEPTWKDVEVETMGVIFYDNEDVVFKGEGTTYNAKIYSTPVVAGDVFVIKLEGITKPADSPDNSYLRFRFYNDNNVAVIADKFFYASNTPLNTEITIPDGCVKLTYIFGMSVNNPSVLDGEYKWSGLTFKQLSRNDARFRNVETRVTELETLSNDWNGKILTTYGDSVTALQGGDFSYPYDLTNTERWGNRVANYLKMSKHYGRGIGGQKYAWGTNGGAITWVYKDTGIMYNRNDAFNLDNWDGSSLPTAWTDAQKNTVLNGLANGTMLSIRGCACSWLRITSMYPESIKNSIDAVFVMFHNDSVDGNEFSWVEGDTTDPEWAASSYYATYGGDYNISTLEGGIASTIMKLQAWLPNAVIILGTPINGQGTTGQLRPDANGLYKQVQHVKNVGLRFSIPVIDVYATCGINGLNRTEYITDGIHPYSVVGSKMIARAIIGGFKTILPNGAI